MRLIDAEPLLKAVKENKELYERERVYLEGLLLNAPIMDLRPRLQGEWENDSDNLPICNKCGEIALQRIFVKMPHLIQDVRMVRSNYCPNCGAEMRGGAK